MEQQRYTRRRPRRTKNKCQDCKHAKLDETWGDYKCTLHQRRISKPNDYTDCEDFATTSKRD